MAELLELLFESFTVTDTSILVTFERKKTDAAHRKQTFLLPKLEDEAISPYHLFSEYHLRV